MTFITQVSRSPVRFLLALAAAALLLLAGCGGSDETSTSAEEPAVTETGGETTTTPAADDDEGGGENGESEGSEKSANEPKTVDQADAPPVETVGIPKAPKGGDDSIQTFGNDASDAELRAASAALDGYLRASVDKDWALACAYLASGMVEQLTLIAEQAPEGEGLDCAGLLKSMGGGIPKSVAQRMTDIQIGGVRVEDDRGFVIYKEAGKTWMVMPMAREDGEWKVGGLAGSPVL